MNSTPPSPRQTVTRAVVTQTNGRAQLREIDLPTPQGHELVLGLEGCGLCGTDLFKIQQRCSQGSTDPKQFPPIVLGHELVGRVTATGPSSPFEKGQRLAVAHHVPCGRCRLCQLGAETNCACYLENLFDPGGFSERILIRERATLNSAFPIPESLSTNGAIFLEPTACVLRSIARSQLRTEETDAPEPAPNVVILGCGSMGLLHILVLRAVHPGAHIVAIDPLPERRERALELGANSIGASSEHMLAQLPEPPMCDAAFDTVGRPEIITDTLPLLRAGGTIVLFAHGAPSQSTSFLSNPFFRAEQRLVASYSSGRIDQVRAFELLCSDKFDPSVLVTHQLPLTEFEQAVYLAKTRQALKIIITP